jgi:hypothetical protein
VAVRGEREGGVLVTQALGDRDDGLACGQQHARVVVSQIVGRRPGGQSGTPNCCREHSGRVVVLPIDLAHARGEDRPVGGRRELRDVRGELVSDDGGQWHRAAGSRCLGYGPGLGARRDLPFDPHVPAQEVDVLHPECQLFTDTQTEPGLSDHHGAAPRRHGIRECLHLRHRQRDDPLALTTGQLDPHHWGRSDQRVEHCAGVDRPEQRHEIPQGRGCEYLRPVAGPCLHLRRTDGGEAPITKARRRDLNHLTYWCGGHRA